MSNQLHLLIECTVLTLEAVKILFSIKGSRASWNIRSVEENDADLHPLWRIHFWLVPALCMWLVAEDGPNILTITYVACTTFIIPLENH